MSIRPYTSEYTAVYLRVYGRIPGMGGQVHGGILAAYGKKLKRLMMKGKFDPKNRNHIGGVKTGQKKNPPVTLRFEINDTQ